MYLHILEPEFRKNIDNNLVSDLCKSGLLVKKEKLKCPQSLADSGDKTSTPREFLKHYFQNKLN